MGPFGPSSRVSTRPLPPAPPRVECVNSNHNSLKLKWGDSKSATNAITASIGADGVLPTYSLEMENSRGQ